MKSTYFFVALLSTNTLTSTFAAKSSGGDKIRLHNPGGAKAARKKSIRARPAKVGPESIVLPSGTRVLVKHGPLTQQEGDGHKQHLRAHLYTVLPLIAAVVAGLSCFVAWCFGYIPLW